MLDPSKSASSRAQFRAQLSISRKQQQYIAQLEEKNTVLAEENAVLAKDNSTLKSLLKRSVYSPDSARYDSASRITLDNSSISR